ncbi:MAG TPA: hypothetical protein VF438_03095 [Candidatus Paceibacterota bacterium]
MNTHTVIGPLKLLSSSWQFYTKHWKALTTLILLPYGAIFIGNMISQIGTTMGDEPTVGGTILAILGLLLFIAGMIFMVAAAAGLISGVHKLSTESGHQIHFWNQYKLGFHLFWPLVLISVMRGIATFGASMIFMLPGILVSVYTAFVLYSLVVDGKRNMAALTDSFTLVHKRWWKVFGRLIVIGLVYFVGVLIVAGLTFVIRAIFHYGINSLPDGILTGILMSVLVLIFIPMLTIYLYKLFESLKMSRFEGARVKHFREWCIACMVIGIVMFVAAVIFGNLLGGDHGNFRRGRYDGNLAITGSADVGTLTYTNGNLVL